MEELDYNKQLYLYDDRSKEDFLLKVSKIIFEDEKSILCETVMIGSPEYANQVEEERILIDKDSGAVLNSNFYSWLATSDEVWANEEVEKMIDRYEE